MNPDDLPAIGEFSVVTQDTTAALERLDRELQRKQAILRALRALMYAAHTTRQMSHMHLLPHDEPVSSDCIAPGF